STEETIKAGEEKGALGKDEKQKIENEAEERGWFLFLFEETRQTKASQRTVEAKVIKLRLRIEGNTASTRRKLHRRRIVAAVCDKRCTVRGGRRTVRDERRTLTAQAKPKLPPVVLPPPTALMPTIPSQSSQKPKAEAGDTPQSTVSTGKTSATSAKRFVKVMSLYDKKVIMDAANLNSALKTLQALIQRIKDTVEKLSPEMRQCADDMESGVNQMEQLIDAMVVNNENNK
ncbi:unnamed protein product, partial [Toxocara canis]|uniref:Polyprotein n=1 Tax=Toxocara canis TaxID=6265 RepID=A0A183UCG7_TOXCA